MAFPSTCLITIMDRWKALSTAVVKAPRVKHFWKHQSVFYSFFSVYFSCSVFLIIYHRLSSFTVHVLHLQTLNGWHEDSHFGLLPGVKHRWKKEDLKWSWKYRTPKLSLSVTAGHRMDFTYADGCSQKTSFPFVDDGFAKYWMATN